MISKLVADVNFILISLSLSLPCCLGNHQTAYHMCHIHWQIFKYRNRNLSTKRRNNATTMQFNATIIIWQSVPTSQDVFVSPSPCPISKPFPLFTVLSKCSPMSKSNLQVLLYICSFFHPCIPVLDWCQNWQSWEECWLFIIIGSVDHTIN